MLRRNLIHIAPRSTRLASAKLDEHTTRLCAIAGYTAAGNLSELAKIWKTLPEKDHAEASEIVLQNITMNGIPRTLMALTTISEVGLKDRIVIDDKPSSVEKHKDFSKAGLDLIKDLYGYKANRYLIRTRLLHPAFGHWVQDFMYGRVRSRPGPSQRVKSLCELAAIGGQFVLPQFRGGIMTAITAGANMEEVRAVLDMTGDIWGTAQQARVDALWRDLSMGRMKSGWKIDSPEVKKKNLIQANIKLAAEDGLRDDWSHFRSHESLITPTWRHPLVVTFRNVFGLSDRQRIYALVGAHAVSGNLSALRRDWSFLSPRYHKSGLEAALEIAPFSGFYRLQNALRTLLEQGVSRDAVSPEVEDNLDTTKFRDQGREVLENIYSKGFGQFEKAVIDMHPDLWNWILEWAYGQVMARPGLSTAEREFIALASMSGSASFPQMRDHMYGTLNAGATTEQLRGILDMTSAVWGRPPQRYVDGYWLEFEKEQLKIASASL